MTIIKIYEAIPEFTIGVILRLAADRENVEARVLPAPERITLLEVSWVDIGQDPETHWASWVDGKLVVDSEPSADSALCYALLARENPRAVDGPGVA